MKTKIAVLKTKINKRFVLGVVIIFLISIGIILIGMKNIYDYLFIGMFDYFMIKCLYYKYYLD